jgi:hypothetical protein
VSNHDARTTDRGFTEEKWAVLEEEPMRKLVVAALVVWGGASWSGVAEGAVLRVRGGERIQAALDRARWGDMVVAGPGLYREVLRLPGGVTLRSEAGWGETRLEGNGAGPIVICEGPGDRAIEGFMITGGPADGAALRAFLLQEGHLAIRDCRFVDNAGDGIAATIYGDAGGLTVADTILDGNQGRGIALDAGYARVLLLGNRLHDNRQGGLWLSLSEGAELTARENEIADNLGDDGAGIAGLVVDGAVARLSNNRLLWNRARARAGIHLVASAARIEAWNNLVARNLAFESHGGVLLVARDGGAVTFGNNTVVHNEAPVGAAVAIETTAGGTARVVNSILWGNTPVDLEGITASYSLVGRGPIGGLANLAQAPRFVAPEQEDYRLLPRSPGVDAGSNAALPMAMTRDCGGEGRIVGRAVDCGAYEMAPAALRLERLTNAIAARRMEGSVTPRVAGMLRMRALSAAFILARFHRSGASWALYHLRVMSRLVSEEAGREVAPPVAPGLLAAIGSITRQVEVAGG